MTDPIPPFPPSVRKVVDGEAVQASITNKGPDDLTGRTDHLKSRLDSAQIGQILVLTNQLIDTAVLEGNLVFRDPVTKKFQQALGGLRDLPDSTTGVIEVDNSSYAWGVVINKTSATIGDIQLMGILPSDFDYTNTIDGTPGSSGKFPAGPYFLSSEVPGKATLEPTISGLYQFFLSDDGSAFLLPSPHGILEDHIHRLVELTAEPAGLANCVDSVDDTHEITVPNSALPGWLPADDPVFGTAAPVGAKFGYNVAQDTELSSIFPPSPLQGTFLQKNGVTVSDNDVIIDNSGIWWLRDDFGNVPWPVDIEECGGGGSSSSILDPETIVELRLFMTEFVTKTDKTVVTNLKLTPGEQSIQLLSADGSPNTFGTGALQIGLNLNLISGDDNLAGALVVKEITDNVFKRGPIVERIISGSSGLVSVSGTLLGGQGEVTIDIPDLPNTPEDTTNLKVVAVSPPTTVKVLSGSLWYEDGTKFVNSPSAKISPIFTPVTASGKARYDLLVLDVDDLKAAAPQFLEIVAGIEVTAPGDPFDDGPTAPDGKLPLAIVKIDADAGVGVVDIVDADITNIKTLNTVVPVGLLADLRQDGVNAAGAPDATGSVEATGTQKKFALVGHAHPTNTTATLPPKDSAAGSAGTATTYMRSDASAPINVDNVDPEVHADPASPGTSTVYARRDHAHPEGAGDASIQDHVVSGYTMPTTDPDLTIDVSAGTAFINNKKIVIASPTAVVLDNNDTNHLFLIDNGTIVANTTDIPPANSTKLGQAITDATTVTSTINGDRERSPYTTAAALELIERKDITSPVTGLTFVDLYGDRDVVYKIIAHIKKDATFGGNRIDVRPNGITTNQIFKDLSGGGGGTVMKLGNIAAANESVFIDALFNAKSGLNRHASSFWNNPSLAMEGDNTISVWGIDQSTVVTSLEIVGTLVNGMVDGFIALYRVRQ